MIISPFTPLQFVEHKSDGIESRHIQTFAKSDCILLQVFDTIMTGATPETWMPVALRNEETGATATLTPLCYQISGNDYLFQFELQGLPTGYYSLRFTSGGSQKSNVFRVTDDVAELANTTLIQYAMKDNRYREDALFNLAGVRYFFDFRVPGGFKDSQWSFGVDNEQFMTSDADIVELSALDYTVKRFTMGGGDGVPVWFGEMLNRLLCCHYVYFDGVRYARKDSSVPEMNVQLDGLDSFVFSQQLQKVNHLNPTIENANLCVMRRTAGNEFRAVDNNFNRIVK